MQASQIAGGLCLALMLFAGLMSQEADSGLERKVWYGIGLAAIFAAIASQNLKGWIGQSYSEMKEEIARLERLMARWERPDGTPVPLEDRRKIGRRYQRLIESIQFHPENPRR